MRKNKIVLLIAILFLFSLINLATCELPSEKRMQSDLDSRVRALFAETSSLFNFEHRINGQKYQYTLSYESGLQVTFTLNQPTTRVTKGKPNFILTHPRPPTQSQASITQYLLSIKQLSPDYVLKLFAVLSDGYLIQYQWEETLITFQLNWNLQIRSKGTKQINSARDEEKFQMGVDALTIPVDLLGQGNGDTSRILSVGTRPSIFQSRLLIATSQTSIKQDNSDGLTQFLVKGDSIDLSSNTKIQNISKIGNTNRYLIEMTVKIKQREIPYQLIIRNGTNGYSILGGSYSIDFSPSYQEDVNINQPLYNWMDQLIRTKLQLIMPAEVELASIWEDDPYYKLSFTTLNTEYDVQFIFDSMLKKVNITNIIVTEDIISDFPTANALNTNMPLNIDSNSNLSISESPANLLYSSPSNIPYAILTPMASESIIATKTYPSQFSIYLTQDCNDQPYNVVHVTHRLRNSAKNVTKIDTASNSNLRSVDVTKSIWDITFVQPDPTQNIYPSPPKLLIATTPAPTPTLTIPSAAPTIPAVPPPTPTSISTIPLPTTSTPPPTIPPTPTTSIPPPPSSYIVNPSIQNMIVDPIDQAPTLTLQDILAPPLPTPNQTSSNSSAYDTFNPSNLSIDLQTISQLVPYTKQQVLNVLIFLQKTETSVSFTNAKIYIIQKFEYGFRIVFIIGSQYLQFILKTSLTNSYTVISMRNVTQQQAGSVTQFSLPYPISLDDDLKALIIRTIPQSKTGTILTITNIQLRIQADGLYYQVVIGTDTGNSYSVTIYQKLEENFSEVLSYQKISSLYYMTDADVARFAESNVNLTNTVQWNLDLFTVLDFVNYKFEEKFSSYGVTYVYKSIISTLNVVRYRIGFVSKSGVYYEVIVIYLNSLSSPILLKYVKLYDGYGLTTKTSAEAVPALSLFQAMLQQQIRQINISNYQVENVLVKQIPLVGKLYKLVLSSTLNFEATVFVNMQGLMFVYGIDGRPTFYSTLLNLNYTSLSDLSSTIQSIRNFVSASLPGGSPPTYSTFPTVNYNFSSTANPNSGTYNAQLDLYCLKANGTYCLSCYNRFYPLNGKCVPIPTPCMTYNNITGECLSCYTGFYLSNGTCTEVNLLCSQSDSNGICIQCYNDYLLLNNLCYSSKGIVSATLNNMSVTACDPLCEQYQNKVCSKCVSGAYISTKFKGCAIQDPNALLFDTVNEVAITCVRGYAVSEVGTCMRTI